MSKTKKDTVDLCLNLSSVVCVCLAHSVFTCLSHSKMTRKDQRRLESSRWKPGYGCYAISNTGNEPRKKNKRQGKLEKSKRNGSKIWKDMKE